MPRSGPSAPAQSVPPPPPTSSLPVQGQPTASSLKRALLVGAGSSIVAIGVGYFSLTFVGGLVGLAGAAWAAGVAESGSLLLDTDKTIAGFARVFDSHPGPIPDSHAWPAWFRKPATAMLAVLLVPLLFGALGGFIAPSLHHSNRQEVCQALDKFNADEGGVIFDNSWFRTLKHLGEVASRYHDPDVESFDVDVRAAGEAAKKVAEGHGSGPIKTASTYEAYRAILPITNLCRGE